MITVRKPTCLHLKEVLHDIRPADMAEWYAGTGSLFGTAAQVAITDSEFARVALDETDTPLCFWGGNGGKMWLFATKSAERRALSLHKILAVHLEEVEERWGLLSALADGRNVVHHKWLRWLGFEELAEIDIEPFGLPFKMFVKESAKCA